MDKLFTIETHLHTSQSSACADSTGAEMARAHKAAGYDAIILTDHFFGGNTAAPHYGPWAERIDAFLSGYEDARRAGEEIGLKVFLGWEWAWHGTEFLTYGLGRDFLLAHPEMEEWDIPTYLTRARQAGGFISHAHPFRHAPYLTGEPRLFPEYVDAVEVYNCGNDIDEDNDQALAYARRYGLAMTAGSDGHDAGEMRGGGMRFAAPMERIEDFIRAVRTRQPVQILTGKKKDLPDA